MDPRNQHGNQQAGGQTDAYGKPIHHGTTAAGDFSSNPQAQHHGAPLQQTHHAAADVGAQQHGHQAQMVRPATQDPQGVTTLPRSGSGSSSSSEDDEMGGRRKKGLKEKIKEKLPGGHTATTGEHGQAQPTHGTTGHGGGTATTGGYGTTPTAGTHHPVAGAGEQHEKQGMMEKIKEKVPGGHTTTTGEHGQAQPTHGATGHGGGTTAAGGYGTTPTTGTHQQPVGAAGEQHEKKGMMEKIKEKLPGGHQ